MAIIGEVRFSFVRVWEPMAMKEGQPLKFSVMCLIPKDQTKVIDMVKAQIAAAIKTGITKGVISEAQSRSKSLWIPLRDGDDYYTEAPGVGRESCKGHMFFNASSTADRQPNVVDRFAKPIMVRDEFYSGCYGFVDANFFAFNKSGGIGISAGLNSVLKKRDGDRLDGRQSAEQAFAAVTDAEEAEEAGGEGQLV